MKWLKVRFKAIGPKGREIIGPFGPTSTLALKFKPIKRSRLRYPIIMKKVHKDSKLVLLNFNKPKSHSLKQTSKSYLCSFSFSLSRFAWQSLFWYVSFFISHDISFFWRNRNHRQTSRIYWMCFDLLYCAKIDKPLNEKAISLVLVYVVKINSI